MSLNKHIYDFSNSHNIGLYTCRGCCKPIFSKRYAGIEVDVINIASEASPFALLVDLGGALEIFLA